MPTRTSTGKDDFQVTKLLLSATGHAESSAFSDCFAIFKRIPTPSNDNNIDEPPVLINGNGSPFVGIEPVTTAIFIAACKAIETVIPNARKKPNTSGAALQTIIPCHANKANIMIIHVVPIKPNSSPIIEKIKSLSLIGRKNNF